MRTERNSDEIKVLEVIDTVRHASIVDGIQVKINVALHAMQPLQNT